MGKFQPHPPHVKELRAVFQELPAAAFLPEFAWAVRLLDEYGVSQKEKGGVPRHLHRPQMEFAKSQADERWLVASNRSGKSFVGGLEVAWWAHGRHPYREVPPPPNLIWCGFPDWKSHGNQLTQPLLRRMLGPAGVEWKTQQGVFVLENGSRVVLKSYESGPEKWQGAAPVLIWFDEVPPEMIYQECTMRIGAETLCFNGTLTPVYEAAWLYSDVYEPWIDAGEPKNAAFIGGRIEENPHLNQEKVEELRAKLRNDPEMAAIRLRGEWGHMAGRVYPMLRAPVHLVDPFSVPGVHIDGDWSLYRALDVGIRNPTAILWVAVNPDGLAYVYREFYRSDLSIPEVCEAALLEETERERGRIRYTVIDPSSAQRDMADGTRRCDTFARCGIPTIPGNNERMGGISKLREAFHYEKAKDGSFVTPPKYRIFRSCPNTWRELRRLAWTPHKRTSPRGPRDDAQKKDDHAADALRYLEATGSGPVYVKPADKGMVPPPEPDEYTGYA